MPKKIISLDELSRFKSDYDNALETGQIIPSKSLVAQEIETISPESGDTQETPFALQGTGTANGTSSVDTGTVGKHIQKQGSVYCVNQLVDSGTESVTLTNGHRYYTFIDNVRSVVNGTGQSISIVDETKDQVIDLTQWFNGNIPQDLLDHPEHWSWYQTYGEYIPYNTGSLVNANGVKLVSTGRNLFDESKLTGQSGITKVTNGWSGTAYSWNVIDLRTLIIGLPDNRPCSLYAKITSGSSGTAFASIKYEDGSEDKGTSIAANTTGISYVVPSSTNINKKVSSIRISYGSGSSNTIVVTDICFSLYYSGEDYSQYYPYEQPKVYDTGTEELLSTGVKLSVSGEREDVYDYKEPSGLITRRVGVVDLGTLEWSMPTSGLFFSTGLANLIKKPIDNTSTNVIKNLFISDGKYIITYLNNLPQPTGYYIGVADSGRLYIENTDYSTSESFTTGMSGVYLIYELATPTTEQGTPFSENIEINDFGTMGWYSSYTDYTTNTLVSVPQGCKIFYPAWYVGFIDTLGQRADIDWNANNVVSQTELSSSIAFKELSSSYIGAITSSQVVAGEFYKNNIAITGGLTNAKYVIAVMSNGNKYPMIITSSLLVTYSGTSWQASNLTVTKIYYKE